MITIERENPLIFESTVQCEALSHTPGMPTKTAIALSMFQFQRMV